MAKKKKIEDDVGDDNVSDAADAIKDINRFLKDDDLQAQAFEDVEDFHYWLDSGSYALNFINSGKYDRCFPGGKTIDLSGDSGCGKSLMLATILADNIRKGGISYIIDTENAWNKSFAMAIIGDEKIVNALQINKSLDTIERLEIFLERLTNVYVSKGLTMPIVVGIDSISNLSTTHEMALIATEQNDKKDMFKAGLIKRMFRTITRKQRVANLTLVTTNHLIANIGVKYGPQKVTGGGTGVPYMSDVRIEFLKPEKIENEKVANHPIGVRVRPKVTKNRIVGDGRRCEIDIMFRGGPDKYAGLMELLGEYGTVDLYNKNNKFGKDSEINADTRVLFQVEKAVYDKWPQFHAKKYYSGDDLAKLKKKGETPEIIPLTLEFKAKKLKEFLKEFGEINALEIWQKKYGEILKIAEQPEDLIADSTGEDEDIEFAENILKQVEEPAKVD